MKQLGGLVLINMIADRDRRQSLYDQVDNLFSLGYVDYHWDNDADGRENAEALSRVWEDSLRSGSVLFGDFSQSFTVAVCCPLELLTQKWKDDFIVFASRLNGIFAGIREPVRYILGFLHDVGKEAPGENGAVQRARAMMGLNAGLIQMPDTFHQIFLLRKRRVDHESMQIMAFICFLYLITRQKEQLDAQSLHLTALPEDRGKLFALALGVWGGSAADEQIREAKQMLEGQADPGFDLLADAVCTGLKVTPEELEKEIGRFETDFRAFPTEIRRMHRAVPGRKAYSDWERKDLLSTDDPTISRIRGEYVEGVLEKRVREADIGPALLHAARKYRYLDHRDLDRDMKNIAESAADRSVLIEKIMEKSGTESRYYRLLIAGVLKRMAAEAKKEGMPDPETFRKQKTARIRSAGNVQYFKDNYSDPGECFRKIVGETEFPVIGGCETDERAAIALTAPDERDLPGQAPPVTGLPAQSVKVEPAIEPNRIIVLKAGIIVDLTIPVDQSAEGRVQLEETVERVAGHLR